MTQIETGIVLDQVAPKLGDRVTFTALAVPKKYTAEDLYVQIEATRSDGQLLWATAGRLQNSFLLGGLESLWTHLGVPATCVATLYVIAVPAKYIPLAFTTFEVAGA